MDYKKTAIAAVGIIVALMAVFVWPTLYKYDKHGPEQRVIKINRITGDVSVLTYQGWTDLRPAPQTVDAPDAPMSPTSQTINKDGEEDVTAELLAEYYRRHGKK